MRHVPVLALTTLLCASIVGPANSAPLQPAGQWAVDYGETQCTAVRPFGTATDPIVLGIVPSLNGDTDKLIVSVPHKGPKFAEEMHGTVDFGHAKIRTWLLHYGQKDVQLSDYQFRVSAAEMEQARTAASVALRSDGGVDYEFALSEMPALLDALKACTADLQQYWTGPRAVSPLSRSAKGDIRSAFSSEDYPTEALSRRQEGMAQYQLMIDPTGRVVGCDVLRQSGVPILDVMGCQVIIDRVRFTPALDAQGKPTRDVVTTPPISWKLAG